MSGVTECFTGLIFKKNLTADFQEFASVNGSKFIAKYANGKMTIAYNYSYTNGSYTYDNPGLVDIVESNIVPTDGAYDAIGKMQGASLFGDAGDDYLFGGARADYLSGGLGKDTIFGGEGHDVIDGGLESDFILGSEGDDLVIGGEGDDTIFGSKGGARAEASDNDVLYGGSGADKIYGGMGRDYIDGGIGLDELRGGEGDGSDNAVSYSKAA